MDAGALKMKWMASFSIALIAFAFYLLLSLERDYYYQDPVFVFSVKEKRAVTSIGIFKMNPHASRAL